MKDVRKKETNDTNVFYGVRTPEKVMKSNKKDLIKVFVFNFFNLLLLIAIFIIVRKLPQEAEKIKSFRTEQVASRQTLSAAVLQAELDDNEKDLEKIKNAFLDEEKFIDFIKILEGYKQQGLIQEYNFPVASPVPDGDGFLGIPVTILMQGRPETISRAYQQIYEQNYVIRPVNVNLEYTGAEEDIYLLRLGLFIYVDENFNQN